MQEEESWERLNIEIHWVYVFFFCVFGNKRIIDIEKLRNSWLNYIQYWYNWWKNVQIRNSVSKEILQAASVTNNNE